MFNGWSLFNYETQFRMIPKILSKVKLALFTVLKCVFQINKNYLLICLNFIQISHQFSCGIITIILLLLQILNFEINVQLSNYSWFDSFNILNNNFITIWIARHYSTFHFSKIWIKTLKRISCQAAFTIKLFNLSTIFHRVWVRAPKWERQKYRNFSAKIFLQMAKNKKQEHQKNESAKNISLILLVLLLYTNFIHYILSCNLQVTIL